MFTYKVPVIKNVYALFLNSMSNNNNNYHSYIESEDFDAYLITHQDATNKNGFVPNDNEDCKTSCKKRPFIYSKPFGLKSAFI